VAGVVAGMAPEAMVHGGPATESGSLRADALDRWGRDLAQFDAVLVGPGMTRHEASGKLLGQVLRTRRGVVVADADALNSCAGNPEALAAGCPLVITPHPGEMARLLCRTAADVQAARVATAREMAERTKAVTVLKGAGTVVAAAGRNAHVNLTGNPGMATGGMGDVLAGMIAGLAGQGLAPFDAARAAVYLHGRAGDNVAWRSSQTGMTAGDVVEELPHAFRDLAAR
jgi:NAD(P)H-hydrate epimerase